VYVMYFCDGSVFKCVDDGELVLVSSLDRVSLNEQGENRAFGQDIDYWLQLFCIPEERKNGVFTADLTARLLSTKDNEGNYFALRSNG